MRKMVVVRKWGENHINQSVRQVDENSWLVGDLMLRRSSQPSDAATWQDDDGSNYSITEAPNPRPKSTPPNSPHIKLVHEAGDASAVWSIGGNAFCKARYREEGVTLESTTINFVRAQKVCFGTPEVLHHAMSYDRSFLFLRRVPGRTLASAWPSLNDFWRHHYVNAVVQACLDMATWESKTLGGVDGQHMAEYFLVPPDLGFESIEAGCQAVGLDVSDLVFCHADLGPGNILVEHTPKVGNIGIIDFEIAGFLPRGWIRTKFRLSSGMDLPESDTPTLWRKMVQFALGAKGFSDYSQAWMEWCGYS